MANHVNGNGELVVPSSVARLNYFYGQLLAQRDLRAEQSYHVVLRRLVQRETFGTGTTAGLRVDVAGPAMPRGVFVRAGLGFDPDGRELLLETDVCIDVAAPAVAPSPPDPLLTGTTPAELRDELFALWGQAIDESDVVALRDRFAQVGFEEALVDTPDAYAGLRAVLNMISPPPSFTLPPVTRLVDYLFDALVATSFVGLRYAERGSEPAPPVLDTACCGETTCFPARMQQGVVVVTRSTPFEAPPDPFESARIALSECFLAEENPDGGSGIAVGDPHHCRACLADYLLRAWRALPAPGSSCTGIELPIVPLAAVYWTRQERRIPAASRVLSVDNHRYRPLAPGPATLHALFDVVTQCCPPVAVPPIYTAIEPADGAELVVPGSVNEIVLRAEATSRLDETASFDWFLRFYPAGAGEVVHWSSAGAPPTPPFEVEAQVENDGVRGRVLLRLHATPGPLTLEPGVYLWGIGGTSPTGAGGAAPKAATTAAEVDGDPNPPNAVPTGDGRAGGVFVARFYVTGS